MNALATPHPQQRLVDRASKLVLQGWLGKQFVIRLIEVDQWNTLLKAVEDAEAWKAWLEKPS